LHIAEVLAGGGRILMGQARTWQAMRFHARAGEKLRTSCSRAPCARRKPLFVAKRRKGMASLADDGLEFEMLRSAPKTSKIEFWPISMSGWPSSRMRATASRRRGAVGARRRRGGCGWSSKLRNARA
jgi:hypothetical protein